LKSAVDTVKNLTIEDTAKDEDEFTEPLNVGKRNTALDQVSHSDYNISNSLYF
jgi:hypothetical protein